MAFAGMLNDLAESSDDRGNGLDLKGIADSA
jgi:hypothetical protein